MKKKVHNLAGVLIGIKIANQQSGQIVRSVDLYCFTRGYGIEGLFFIKR
jgi:hypothetical protein